MIVGKPIFNLTLAAVALLSAGCESGTNAVAEGKVLTRDSSGIRITEISAASAQGAPRITLTEDLRIGGESDTAQRFTSLFDVDIAGDGRIFALDVNSRSVRVFTADGAFVRSVGREGSGPGEFANEPLGITLSGNSLFVRDRYRFHTFDTLGRHLHSVDHGITGNPPISLFERHGSQLLIGINLTAQPVDAGNLVVRDTFRVFPADPASGASGNPTVQTPGALRWFEELGGRSVPQFLGPLPSAAVRENGEIYLARGDRYEISVLSPSGSVIRIVRALVHAPEYSEGDHASAVAHYDSARVGSYGKVVAQGMRTMERPTTRPMTGRLFVSPSGTVLVERRDLDPDVSPRATTDTAMWDLLRSDGQIMGRVAVAPGVSLHALTDTHLVAVSRDSLDVQSIVRYVIPKR